MEEQSFSFGAFLLALLYSIIVWIILGFCLGIGLWLAGEVTQNDWMRNTGKRITNFAFRKKDGKEDSGQQHHREQQVNQS